MISTLFALAILLQSPPAAGDTPTPTWSVQTDKSIPIATDERRMTSDGGVAVHSYWLVGSSEPRTLAVAITDAASGDLRWSNAYGSLGVIHNGWNKAVQVVPTPDPTGTRVAVGVHVRLTPSISSLTKVLLEMRNAHDGSLVWKIDEFQQLLGTAYQFVFSADGAILVRYGWTTIGTADHLVLDAFDATDGTHLWNLALNGGTTNHLGEVTMPDEERTHVVVPSPDGSRLFVVLRPYDTAFFPPFGPNQIAAIDLASGTQEWIVAADQLGYAVALSDLVVSNDSQHLYLSTSERLLPTAGPPQVACLSATNGQLVWKQDTARTLGQIALSPDGSSLALGSTVQHESSGAALDELVVESRNTSDGSLQWSDTTLSSGDPIEMLELEFGPTGSRLFGLTSESAGGASPSAVQLYTWTAATGAITAQVDALSLLPPTIPKLIPIEDSSGTDDLAVIVHHDIEFGTGHVQRIHRSYDHFGSVVLEASAQESMTCILEYQTGAWIDTAARTVRSLHVVRERFLQAGTIHAETRDLQTGALLSSVALHSPPGSPYFPRLWSNIETSPDGRFASAIFNTPPSRLVCIYDLTTGHVKASATSTELTNDWLQLDWNPTQPILAVVEGSGDATLRLLQAETGQMLALVHLTLPFMSAPFASKRCDVIHSPDGSAVYTLVMDRVVGSSYEFVAIVRRHDPSTGAIQWEKELTIDFAGLTGGFKKSWLAHADVPIFVSDRQRTIVAFESATGAIRWQKEDLPFEVLEVVGLPERGEVLIATREGSFSGDDQVRVLDTSSGSIERVITLPRILGQGAFDRGTLQVLGDLGRIALLRRSVALLPDFDPVPRTVATGSTATVIDLRNGAILHEIEGLPEDCYALAFDDANSIVAAGASNSEASWGVDAQIQSYRGAALQSGPDEVSLASGGVIAFHVDEAPTAAGRVYVIATSITGTAPGVPVGAALPLPIVQDWLTSLALGWANNGEWPGFIGTLDAKGDARATLVILPGSEPALAGLELYFAGLVLDPSGTADPVVTQPVVHRLVP